MKFREHRGSLAESMKTVVELNTKEDFCKHLNMVVRKFIGHNEFTLSFKEYSFDTRINWDTWLVVIDGDGVIGMLDGHPPINWWPPVEFVYDLGGEA
jgi:hypothetical protein